MKSFIKILILAVPIYMIGTSFAYAQYSMILRDYGYSSFEEITLQMNNLLEKNRQLESTYQHLKGELLSLKENNINI